MQYIVPLQWDTYLRLETSLITYFCVKKVTFTLYDYTIMLTVKSKVQIGKYVLPILIREIWRPH